MAAIVNRREVGFQMIGDQVVVPDDPRALLMFYLKSICNVMEPGLQRLTDYQNYRSLQDSELKILLFFCVLLSPDELEGKCIFKDEDGKICGQSVNQFCELSAVQNQFLVTENILIGNQQRHIKKVMFYRPIFILKYFELPLIQIKVTLDLLEAAEQEQREQQRQAQLRQLQLEQRRQAQRRQQHLAIQYQQRRLVVNHTPPVEQNSSSINNHSYSHDDEKKCHERYLLNLCICLFFPPWIVCWICMCMFVD